MLDRYRRQREAFIRETSEHEMTVLHDDGQYRHIRFQRPGTSIWYFDLVTWPGSLAIRGDIGEGHIFTRTENMLTFFDHGQAEHEINADYWAEKLDLGRTSVKEFSTDRFVEWCAESAPNLGLHAAEVGYEQEAIELLDEHEAEWDTEDIEMWRDYGYHFILALHAILWGAKRYHAAHPSTDKKEG